MPLCDALWAVWATLLSLAHILMAEQENPENYSDEKLLALAIADIKAKRSAFYESGEPFTLPKEEFERQWMGVDGWYTYANRRGTKSYYNCRLNQTRNYAIANKKPDDYVNPTVGVSFPSKSTTAATLLSQWKFFPTMRSRFKW